MKTIYRVEASTSNPETHTPSHTPGPWSYDESRSGTITINAGDKVIVADLPKQFQAIEDARLIAAAPELLEALELMLNTCAPGTWTPQYKTAYNAIKKAKGMLTKAEEGERS